MLSSVVNLPKDTVRPPETILVNITPQETRVAILEEGQVCELHIERGIGKGLVGNIYLGVVQRVLPGIQSAFIDIGLERAAFLHIVDVVQQRQNASATYRIEHLIFEGQTVLVQVIKDPIGQKGARLSTQISLAGRFLVHLPQDEHIGISQRIEDENERTQLKQRLSELLPESACHGYIIRTCAETATDEELHADTLYLTKLWQNIRTRSQTASARTLLYQELPLSLRVLRDMFNHNTVRILVDSYKHYCKMREFGETYVHGSSGKIELFQEGRPLFETYDVEQAINHALQPRINLEFGGYLILETTEAMTTIDVNTGGFVGTHNFHDTIFKTNLEACHAIARELRLRNLGGIIIVDFIDMEKESHREAILQELAKVLSLDRMRITVNGFTSLGLVEITRKRVRENLYHVLSEACPVCHGNGYLKTPQTICYEIIRMIIREANRFNTQGFRVLASAVVIEMFLDEEAEALAKLCDFIGQPIYLVAEACYTQEEFDIILI